MGAIVLSFAAGALSVLSPCVLPLLPIVVASALQQHRHGPLALAAGLVLASAGTGLLFASLGFAFDVDRATARTIAAALMGMAGVVLIVPRLQAVVATLAAPLARGAAALSGRQPAGLRGQFALFIQCVPKSRKKITLYSRNDSGPDRGLGRGQYCKSKQTYQRSPSSRSF